MRFPANLAISRQFCVSPNSLHRIFPQTRQKRPQWRLFEISLDFKESFRRKPSGLCFILSCYILNANVFRRINDDIWSSLTVNAITTRSPAGLTFA